MIYKIPSTAIVHELIDQEVIIANLDTGLYYSLRGCAIPAWQLLLCSYPPAKIATLFKEKFSQNIAGPLNGFIHQLLEEELIVEGKGEGVFPNDLYWPPELTSFSLEKYEEKKNLLMFDPIDEVDD